MMIPCALEIVDVLSNQVRYLSLSQIASHWFSHDLTSDDLDSRCLFYDKTLGAVQNSDSNAIRHASSLIKKLSENGWLQMAQIFCRPIMPMYRPLFEWRHTQSSPPYRELARQLGMRARSQVKITTVVCATKKAKFLFGSGESVHRPKLAQATHDLHLAEVYLVYRQRDFDVRHRWLGEEVLPLNWPIRQRPDAVLVDHDGHFIRAIEYGGNYSMERLSALHHGLESIPLAYEIW